MIELKNTVENFLFLHLFKRNAPMKNLKLFIQWNDDEITQSSKTI